MESEMLYEFYTWEKLRELERAGRARKPGKTPRRPAPVIAVAALAAARLLRGLGAGLEGWAEPRESGRKCCEACG
jgi:hypothetical protein